MDNETTARPNRVVIAGKEYIPFPDGLASELNKSTRTVQRWDVARIGPPVIEIGNTRMVDPDDIPAWLLSRKRKPARLDRGRRRAA